MGKNANKRKSEKVIITPIPKLDPKAFIAACKAIAAQYGWVTGYSPDESIYAGFTTELVALVNTLPNRKAMQRQIGNAFPNKGTYTYTDGTVDYVLGLLMQPTPGVIPTDQKDIALNYV